MLDPKKVSVNLALFIAAAGTWWLAESLVPQEPPPPKLDGGQIDYISKNIRRTVLTAEGKTKEVLVAELMTHYKNDDRTELEKPVMTLYKEKGEPWVIRSDTGTSLSGGEAVWLRGNVLITRKNDKGEEMKIITRNVKYIPNKDYAETSEHVLMVSSSDTTSGEGAQVYFEPVLKINLLGDVRRKHETTQ